MCLNGIYALHYGTNIKKDKHFSFYPLLYQEPRVFGLGFQLDRNILERHANDKNMWHGKYKVLPYINVKIANQS